MKSFSCGTVRALLAALIMTGALQAEVTRMLLADEGNGEIHYVNLDSPGDNWTRSVDGNRDMQLIGSNRVLISKGNGYTILDLSDGSEVKTHSGSYGVVHGARRMPDGHTWLGSEGVHFIELDENDEELRRISFGGYGTLRGIRITSEKTLLFGSQSRVLEGDTSGNIIWEATLNSGDLFGSPQAYFVIRLADGNTMVSCGYGKRTVLIDPDGNLIQGYPAEEHTGDDGVDPGFYGGFHILSNGHVVQSNWKGHGPGNGNKGRQVIEYDADGNLVWAWEQDPDMVSSLHGVLVLDGLNTGLLHTNVNGPLAPWVENDPAVTVTSPNGGESWEAGSTRNINWSSTGELGDVKIEYTTGNEWHTVVAATTNTGTYEWTVPDDASTTVKVRVGSTDGAVTDESDAGFTIQGTVLIGHRYRPGQGTYPPGGSSARAGPIREMRVFGVAGQLIGKCNYVSGLNGWSARAAPSRILVTQVETATATHGSKVLALDNH